MAATIASAAQSIMSSLAAPIRRVVPRSLAIAAALVLMAIASQFFGDRQATAADAASATRPWIVQELKGAGFSRPRDADDGQWQALRTGARIEAGSVVRTDGSGTMVLSNGIDQIRLSPSSEIELPANQKGDPVTRVIHWIGTAFFHVGKRPGPQFEVDTPYIVAIVKGTKFTTTVSDGGAAIKVSEGIVGVSATVGGSSIDVTAGGSASVSAAHNDVVTPGGPSGDAAPPDDLVNGPALARSGDEPAAAADLEAGAVSSAGGALSGGADSDPVDGDGKGATGRGEHGGNGNGRGRDNRDSKGNRAMIGNGDGQGGVDDGGGGDDGGGCHGQGDAHHQGHHHGGHWH